MKWEKFWSKKKSSDWSKEKEDRKEVSLEKNKYFLKQSITRPAKMSLFLILNHKRKQFRQKV